MRYWEFGIFDSHAADFAAMFCAGGRSILSLADDNTNQESSPNTYNPTTGVVGYSPGGPSALHWLAFVRVLMAQVKAKLGQIPVLVNVDWTAVPNETETNRLRLYRLFQTSIDLADSSSRYRDISAGLTWYQDTYGPYPGQDREENPTGDSVATVQLTNGTRIAVSITPMVERALRDNTDLWFQWWPRGNATSFQWKPVDISLRPSLRFSYFYPVEFYADDGAGNLDLSAVIGDTDSESYYIGAVERGQTGSAIKEHLRNFSGAVAHIEVFDDHPEYRDPIQKAGSGTGALDYVVLLEPAVSQLYTIVFYSSTEFEIKAEAYRDNVISLHPQIDADASWRGNTSTTFTAPSGGLRIPAEAWQPGTLSGDEIEVAARGNTTNTDWPSDSNDQVEITSDNAGAPVAAGWRPILGRREFLRGSVTVDAASKFFPTRRVLPTDWPISTPAFVQDADSIDEGLISAIQEAALGSVTFSGSGLDDFARSGNHNGNADRVYRIEIDATGTPDTVQISRDGGGSFFATGGAITGALQLIENGVYFMFSATTGHTLNDYWEFDADTFGITLSGLTPGANGYAAGAVIGTTLPFRNVAAAVFTTINADSGLSEPNPARLFVASTAGFTAGDTVHIQQAGTAVFETAVIDTGGVTGTYLQMTAALANDYTVGDFATKVGAGEAAFWLRPVATLVTTEELKRIRLNARIL